MSMHVSQLLSYQQNELNKLIGNEISNTKYSTMNYVKVNGRLVLRILQYFLFSV